MVMAHAENTIRGFGSPEISNKHAGSVIESPSCQDLLAIQAMSIFITLFYARLMEPTHLVTIRTSDSTISASSLLVVTHLLIELFNRTASLNDRVNMSRAFHSGSLRLHYLYPKPK